MKRLPFLLFLGACSFLGGTATALLTPRLTPLVLAQIPDRPSSSAPTSDLLRIGDRFEQVARQVAPAVVAVEASKPSATGGATGRGKPVEESGSGVLIKAEG